jgi:Ser/Thr protein kinase RdoA (MazF antagonist)
MQLSEIEVRAAEAARHWPITRGEVRFHTQRENAVFRVETTEGPHALRVHRPGYHTAATILSELEWMAMLDEGGLVVPRPARSTEGSYLVQLGEAEGQARCFSLLSWLPGTPFGSSAEPLLHAGEKRTQLMHAIGGKLAKLHSLSDHWTPSRTFQRPAWDGAGLLGESPVWGRFWDAAWLTHTQRQWLSYVRSRCSAALMAYEKSGADFGLIHADLARENVLVNGDNVTFIDFDDSGTGYRMFDIATALIKNIHEPDFTTLSQALLKGYQRERRLRELDLQALPLAMVLRSLTYLGWVNDRMAEPGMAQKSVRFLRDAEYLWNVHGEFV